MTKDSNIGSRLLIVVVILAGLTVGTVPAARAMEIAGYGVVVKQNDPKNYRDTSVVGISDSGPNGRTNVGMVACVATVYTMIERARGFASAKVDDYYPDPRKYNFDSPGAAPPGYVGAKVPLDGLSLLKQLDAKNPVILDSVAGANKPGVIQHTVLVVGYEVNGPGYNLLINDPETGTRRKVAMSADGIITDGRHQFDEMRLVGAASAQGPTVGQSGRATDQYAAAKSDFDKIRTTAQQNLSKPSVSAPAPGKPPSDSDKKPASDSDKKNAIAALQKSDAALAAEPVKTPETQAVREHVSSAIESLQPSTTGAATSAAAKAATDSTKIAVAAVAPEQPLQSQALTSEQMGIAFKLISVARTVRDGIEKGLRADEVTLNAIENVAVGALIGAASKKISAEHGWDSYQVELWLQLAKDAYRVDLTGAGMDATGVVLRSYADTLATARTILPDYDELSDEQKLRVQQDPDLLFMYALKDGRYASAFGDWLKGRAKDFNGDMRAYQRWLAETAADFRDVGAQLRAKAGTLFASLDARISPARRNSSAVSPGGVRLGGGAGTAIGNLEDNVYVGGSVTTTANPGQTSSTRIGSTSDTSGRDVSGSYSTMIGGSVINQGGTLEINPVGKNCSVVRNGSCCIELDAGYCVVSKYALARTQVLCSPNYVQRGRECLLYSDRQHQVAK